ncbi:hydroquinone glucosyltransferase-like [Humulus lupulus]|uniref:hydroquinone glucosyltransferase-like n=1 Tax=Humulus lupulus TaxID=3486 RepID=UPI002B40B5AE|nr:hydroquinone glucosyltransferase-like [Humulus lupulus]
MGDLHPKSPQLPHILIVPTPGMGHLFPLIEFSKRLVAQHDIAITFIVPNDGSSSIELQKKLLQSLPSPISSDFLPPVNMDDLTAETPIEDRIELTLTRSLPALRQTLETLTESTHYAALVVDVFGPAAFEVAQEFNIPPYIFFPTTATVLSFFFYLPKLDAITSAEYRYLPDPVQLPGCIPIEGRDFFSPLHDRKTQTYRAFVRMAEKYNLAAGIMVNSFVDLEPGPFKAIIDRIHGNPPIYPVGPLTQTGSSNSSSEPECLRWLDNQPKGSVIFVSFGSGGTLSQEQFTELATGLELSGQRFLWVIRSPSDKASSAFFTLKSQKSPFDYLPDGFLERTKGLGLVVDSWAPQVRVLAHGSTGGFLTHCGWNSTLESVVHGVPLVAWPLYAEQKMNAVLVGESGLNVGVRVKMNEKGMVGREEICEYVKNLMEGEEGKVMKKRMSELKEAAKLALGHEGSSTKSLAEVAQIWKGPSSPTNVYCPQRFLQLPYCLTFFFLHPPSKV